MIPPDQMNKGNQLDVRRCGSGYFIGDMMFICYLSAELLLERIPSPEGMRADSSFADIANPLTGRRRLEMIIAVTLHVPLARGRAYDRRRART
jgi:hypothetical protein